MFGRLLIAGLGIALPATLCLAADAPDLNGHWQIDSNQSKNLSEHTLSLDLAQSGDQLTFSRTYQDHDGKEVIAKFSCQVGGSACEFMDNGHKAKISLWYNGPELVILKTDGDKRDSTVEWHLQSTDSGKTLRVNREIMEPNDQTEKLVFTRTETVANR